MSLTKTYSKDVPSLIPLIPVSNETSLIMVVDMGHSFIKTSLFAVYEGVRAYALNLEIKETGKIINNGEINYNLLSRYIMRKTQDLSSFGNIDRLVVIPPRLYTNTMQLHKLEYVEKYVDFKKQLIKSYKDIYEDASNIDWGVLTNSPEDDYRNVVIDSLKDEDAIAFGNAFVDAHADSVIVTSPSMAYLGLGVEEPYMVIDIGHVTTTIAIIDKGIAYMRNVSTGGSALTDALAEKNSTLEDMKYKHELNIEELPPTVDITFDILVEEMLSAIDTYKSISLEPLGGYCILGGTGNLQIEEVINDLRTGLKRFYPRVELMNGNTLPTETIQYFLPSISTMNYMVHNINDKERRIDFVASKGNAFRYRVKQVADWFRKNKMMTLAVTASAFLVFGALMLTANKTNIYYAEVNEQKTIVQNEYNSSSSALQSAQEQFNALLANDVNVFTYDTGKLLEKVKSITPPNLNIRQFNLNSADDTGTIVVASPNQVITATLVTLLQDGDGAPFQKADIVAIKKDKDSLEEVYITTIYVEGRNL